jgi:hypothetical protein
VSRNRRVNYYGNPMRPKQNKRKRVEKFNTNISEKGIC